MTHPPAGVPRYVHAASTTETVARDAFQAPSFVQVNPVFRKCRHCQIMHPFNIRVDENGRKKFGLVSGEPEPKRDVTGGVPRTLPVILGLSATVI